MTEPSGGESREVRRERQESFALPVGQIVGIPTVLVVVLAVLLLFSADLVLVLGLLTAAFGVGALIVRQLRGGDAGRLPPASTSSDALADPAAEPPVVLTAAAPRPSAGPEARIIDGWKVVEWDPDGPMPAGAVRCELADASEFSSTQRRWVMVGGALGVVGSLTLKVLTGWGTAFLMLSVGLLWRAGTDRGKTKVLPSRYGRYLAFDAGIPHAGSGMDEAARFLPLALGLVGVLAGGVMWFSGVAPRVEALLFAALGVYGLYRGVKGPDAGDEPFAHVPSLRFQALANPAYPLEGASISHDPAAVAATPRDGGEEGP